MICKCDCHNIGVPQHKACTKCLSLHKKSNNDFVQSAFIMGLLIGGSCTAAATYFFINFINTL